MLLKIPKKFDDKPFQSNALWLNLNKINKYFTINRFTESNDVPSVPVHFMC